MLYPISRLQILAFTLVLTMTLSYGLNHRDANTAAGSGEVIALEKTASTARDADSGTSYYGAIDALMADIAGQIHQPNVRKDDILRGWYLASESEMKYGTPTTWVFFEDGENSKWMSTNVIDERELVDEKTLCESTAGRYTSSCLDTTDADCEYVGESYCYCSEGSGWNSEQGCIQTTDRGSFVSINSAELKQGYYLGLPNDKKLNTPEDWKWREAGRQSMWQRP